MPAGLSRAPEVGHSLLSFDNHLALWSMLVTSLHRGCSVTVHAGQRDVNGVQDSSRSSDAGDWLEINKERIPLPVYSFLSRRQAVILKGANDTMAKTI